MHITDINALHKIIQDIYNISGILTVIYDENFNPICSFPRQHSNFCTIIRKNPILRQRCLDCDNIGLKNCSISKDIHIYRCHMGLTESVSPICENGILIGYIMFGQIISEGDEKKVRTRLPYVSSDYELELAELDKALNKLRIVKHENIISIAKILEMCTCYLRLNRIISVRTDSLLAHLCDYIDKNLSGDLSVVTLCSYLNISKSTLYKLSSQHLGMGISDYVRGKRIEYAKHLLSNNTIMITEVAAKSGLSDANYFTKIFRNYTGMNPSEYRRKNSGISIDTYF